MGVAEWGLVVAVLALLGFDGPRGFRFVRWVFRGFRPEKPAPVPIVVAEPDAPATTYPPIRPPGDREVIGRDDDRKRLHTLLASGKGAQITSSGAVVQGEGGRGKTTLARYYAEKSKDLYDGGLWVPASDASSIMETLAAFGSSAFGIAVPPAITPAHAEAVLQEIGKCDARLLFVYDNVDDFQAIRHLLPKGDSVDLILTTRISAGFPGFNTLPLDVLDFDTPDSPAVNLLLQEAGQWNADDETRAAARLLAEDLGGLPLALIVAGALAKEGTDFDTLRTRIAELVEVAPGQGGDYPDSVAAAVQLSLDTLDDDVRQLADICAWLDPDRIEERLFTDALGGDWWERYKSDVPEDVQAPVSDGARVRAGLRALRDRSLLQVAETGLSLHRLTAAVLRERAPDPEVSARTAAVLLRAVYPGGEKSASDPAHWETCRRLTPHVAALWDHAGPLWRGAWGKPDWRALDTALTQCGVFLSSQSDHSRAADVERAALEMTEARLAEDDHVLPLALGNLSVTLARLGEFDEAAEKIDRAIALYEAHREGGEDLASTYMKKAKLFFGRAEAGERSELDSAEGWIAKARGIREMLAGDTPSADVALCWNDLGYLRHLQGRTVESGEAHQTALDMLRQVPGANRAQIATYALNVGSTWLEARHLDKAEPLLREAYDIQSAIFDDPRNPDLRNSASWLCSCLLTLARFKQDSEKHRAEAEQLCRDHGLDWEERQRVAEQYPTAPSDPA